MLLDVGNTISQKAIRKSSWALVIWGPHRRSTGRAAAIAANAEYREISDERVAWMFPTREAAVAARPADDTICSIVNIEAAPTARRWDLDDDDDLREEHIRKRERVKAMLLDDPTQSNKHIARLTGISPDLVFSIRGNLVDRKQIHEYAFTSSGVGKYSFTHSPECWCEPDDSAAASLQRVGVVR